MGWLAVHVEDDLPRHRVQGLFSAFRLYPGVVTVCDLSAVSQATLDVILLTPAPPTPVRTPLQPELGV